MISGTERCPQKGVVKQVASKLLRALSEKGLALLVNHGIPECKVRCDDRDREGGREGGKLARARARLQND